MNTKAKLFTAGIITLLGIFMNINMASAQAVFTNCNSAMISDYIASNGNPTNVWFEWGLNQHFGNSTPHQIFYSNSNFSQLVSGLAENTTYYYRIVSSNNYGTTTGYTKSFKTPECSFSGMDIGTNLATNISSNSATLNGYTNSGGSYTTKWFEWGTNGNYLSPSTNRTNQGGFAGSFSESLEGLSPNTTYYYRAAIANQYGTFYGNIVSFKTSTPVVYRNTTVSTKSTAETTKQPLVLLSISRNDEIIRVGNIIEYVISYKNIFSKNLQDVVLQISIPKELEFMEANRGYFSSENNTLVADIGNLNLKEEGEVRVAVKVTTKAEIGKIIVIKASLAHTTTNSNTQEEVFAYAKNIVEEGGTIQQGATAFLFGDSFLPDTLIRWFLLILVIILIVLAARKAYYGPKIILAPENSEKKS